jgi:uncharacterized protein (TIGR00297 family)
LSILFQTDNITLNFITGFFLALVISLISYRAKLLTTSGIIATFFLALVIYTFGQWQWTLPIVTFFLLSSLLSKIRKISNEPVELYFEKTGSRDYWQVLANGGLASVLVILNYLYSLELLYIIYVSMIASVCADTWATEIGTLVKTKTLNILTLKRVDQGISGGISFPGTSGALAGAFIIALTSLPWLESNVISSICIIVIAGFFGNIIDSIIGAAFQSQYKCTVCSRLTERKIHCGSKTELLKGIGWINNDAVNLGAGISGGILSLLFLNVMKS